MPRFVIAPDGQAFNPQFVVAIGNLFVGRGSDEYVFSVRNERVTFDVTIRGTEEECTILRDKFIQSLNSTQ